MYGVDVPATQQRRADELVARARLETNNRRGTEYAQEYHPCRGTMAWIPKLLKAVVADVVDHMRALQAIKMEAEAPVQSLALDSFDPATGELIEDDTGAAPADAFDLVTGEPVDDIPVDWTEDEMLSAARETRREVED